MCQLILRAKILVFAVFHRTPLAILCALAASLPAQAQAADADAIGLSPLRREQPALVGTGIPVAQSEAPLDGNVQFEVNPAYVAQPVSLFTWLSYTGSATVYPNGVGSESGHADSVAAVFYGVGGVAPGVQ